MNDGVLFKWINKEEIYNKKSGRGRPIEMEAYINKLNTNYIATRPRC